jgi:parallel beta-helix repeat protein
MKTLSFLLAVIFLISCNTSDYPKKYFFASDGDDNNTGLSEDNPWKNLNMLDSIELSPGDQVLFHKGDTFTGQLNIAGMGSMDNPIIITAYGEGAEPVLKGSASVHEYQLNDAGLVSFELADTVKALFVNGQAMVPARYPNKGYLWIDKGEEQIGILQDKELPHEDGYWDDARLVFRSTDWTYDWIPVREYKNNTFYYDTMDIRYPVREGYGYFLDSKPELLDTANEYHYFAGNGECRFYPPSSANPANLAIEAVTTPHGIYLADSVSHVKISDLNFCYYKKTGIRGKLNKHITIKNCAFKNIDQAGVRFYGLAENCTVQNSNFEDIYGRGISFTNSKKCTVKSNKVIRVGLIPGLGTYGVNGMIGILVEARDETRNAIFEIEDFESDSNYVGLNEVDSCGYIGIRVDGWYNLIEKNIIQYAMLQLSDGGSLYCFRHTENSVFRNNFVYNAIGNNESTAKTHHLIALGIYMDGSKSCELYDNTVVNNTAGIVLNSGSLNHVCKGNILYGNNRNQFSIPTPKEPVDENHEVKNNVFYCTEPEQFCMIQMYRVKDLDFGDFDSNYYCNPYKDEVIQRKWEIEDELTLQEYQKIANKEINSTSCKQGQARNDTLITNKSNEDVSYSFDDGYIDIKGEKVNELTLAPFTSVLLFKKD